MRILAILLVVCGLSGPALGQNQASGLAPLEAENTVSRQLLLSARLTPDGETIERGMTWRIFGTVGAEDGKLPLVATAEGGSATFELPGGAYLVHAAFGRAGATKRVSIVDEKTTEEFVLQAGGLELNATAGGNPLSAEDLRFSVYELERNDEGERKLIALNVAANRVIRLNAGTYHVLSRYGTINATVRADLVVDAGKVTKAVLQHRGSQVHMRLVSETGGAPIANTAWTVFTQDGEKVFDSTSVSPSLILAEGTYEATVQYGSRTLRKNFDVGTGNDIQLEILLGQG